MSRQTIIQVIPSLETGGAEVMLSALARGLQAEGHRVIVYSLYTQETNLSQALAAEVDIRFFAKKPGFDRALLHRLRAAFREDKADVIHSHLYALPYVWLAAGRSQRQARFAHTIHTLPGKEYGRLNSLFNRFLFRTRRVTPVAISPEIQRELSHCYDMAGKEIPMVYNGIDLKKLKVKTSYRLSDPITLIHVGNLKEAKNHLGFLRSFAEIKDDWPNLRLQLVGEGELRPQIETLICELKLEKQVLLLGQRNDVADLLHDADLFLLPSLWEGMPISLVEAMGTALPVLATAVGGIKDMIQSGENAFSLSSDGSDLAEKIRLCLQDEKLRSRLGQAAFRSAQQYSQENMTLRYLDVYAEK